MISYMVIHYGYAGRDEWVEILDTDISDIREAERLRSKYLENNSWDPTHIQVISVKL